MALDPVRTQMPTRTGGRLFKCNCCKSSFAKPTNPAWDFFRGLVCWLFAFFIFIGVIVIPALKGREADRPEGMLLFLLFFLFFGLVVGGVAYVFSSVLSSPRCPECRSTNFAKPD